MTEEERQFYGNPSIEMILEAVPLLHWRRCWECKRIALHRDTVLPACKCRACGSPDTRPMLTSNDVLQRKEKPTRAVIGELDDKVARSMGGE